MSEIKTGVGMLTPPIGGHERETAVEHVQNARQILENLRRDLLAARETEYYPVTAWVDQVTDADKRLLKVLVQLANAVASMKSALGAVTPQDVLDLVHAAKRTP